MDTNIKQLLQRLKGLPLFKKIVPFASGLTSRALSPYSKMSRYIQSIGFGIGFEGKMFKSFTPRGFILLLLVLSFWESSNIVYYFCLGTPLYYVPTITHVKLEAGKVEDLNLFGMHFSFDTESESFRLIDEPRSTDDVFKISNVEWRLYASLWEKTNKKQKQTTK